MKKRSAEKLAQEIGRETAVDFFEYLFESRINGQHRQVKELFHQMNDYSRSEFLSYCVNRKNHTEALELVEAVFY